MKTAKKNTLLSFQSKFLLILYIKYLSNFHKCNHMHSYCNRSFYFSSFFVLAAFSHNQNILDPWIAVDSQISVVLLLFTSITKHTTNEMGRKTVLQMLLHLENIVFLYHHVYVNNRPNPLYVYTCIYQDIFWRTFYEYDRKYVLSSIVYLLRFEHEPF